MPDVLSPIFYGRCRTFGEGLTVDVAPVSCCPLANHVMTAGGLEIADLHVRVMVSPAVACWCPLIVTFSGATETGKQV